MLAPFIGASLCIKDGFSFASACFSAKTQPSEHPRTIVPADSVLANSFSHRHVNRQPPSQTNSNTIEWPCCLKERRIYCSTPSPLPSWQCSASQSSRLCSLSSASICHGRGLEAGDSPFPRAREMPRRCPHVVRSWG